MNQEMANSFGDDDEELGAIIYRRIAKASANYAADESAERDQPTTTKKGGRSDMTIVTATKKRTQPVRAAAATARIKQMLMMVTEEDDEEKVNKRNSANRKIHSHEKEAQPQKTGLRRRHCTESGADAKRKMCGHDRRRELSSNDGRFTLDNFNWNKKLEGE